MNGFYLVVGILNTSTATSMEKLSAPICVGVLGGGQLGRMMAIAGHNIM